MATRAVFPTARTRAGMYESFYLRAFSPREDEPVGVWIRHTVHKRPGHRATGSVWCTIFDARSGAPLMQKLTSDRLLAPDDAWIAVQGCTMGPGSAEGGCGPVRWALRFQAQDDELRHLSPPWLYHAPLPRTKLTSPAPAARFDGFVELADGRPLRLDGWPGMVGHNWGAQHAERWIWLHCRALEGEPSAWLDVALGRILIAGRMTPWRASGALSLRGARHRLGGLTAAVDRVDERPDGCELALGGAGGLVLSARVSVPAGSAAGWRYADPDGGEHDVVNCSVALAELEIAGPQGARPVELVSTHGAAYELGMRERDHGVPIAPFGDG